MKWFEAKLRDPGCFMLVALNNMSHEPVGQIRFDTCSDREANVGLSLDSAKRGLGYGPILIRKGVAWIFDHTDIRVIHAYIKADNIPSVAAFKRAGFVSTPFNGEQGSLHLVFEE